MMFKKNQQESKIVESFNQINEKGLESVKLSKTTFNNIVSY